MSRLHLILFGILVLTIIVICVENEFLRNKPVKTEADRSLQRKVDSLSVINGALEIKISMYKERLIVLTRRIAVKEIKIITLKQSEDEKILAVDSLSSNELYGVFAGFNIVP